MTIELHIITNCVKSAPATAFIDATYKSFCDAFGSQPATVWCDPHPNTAVFDEYRRHLAAAGFPVVNRTMSLADSYTRIIQSARADYVFVLEHDWLFCRDGIRHSLAQITAAMKKAGLYYLRFNQTRTRVHGWDKSLTEHRAAGVDYCLSNCWSGNPHILDRQQCLDLGIVQRIRDRGRFTLERKLTADSDLAGAIYGPMDYPPTIIHTDGRENDPKPFWDQARIDRHYKTVSDCLPPVQNRQPDPVYVNHDGSGSVDLGVVVPAYRLPDQAALKRRFLSSIKKDSKPKSTVSVLFVEPEVFDIVTMANNRPVFNIGKAYNAGINFFKDHAGLIACADIDLLFPRGFIDHAVKRAASKPHVGRVRLVDPDRIMPRNWPAWETQKARPGSGCWNCMSYECFYTVGGFNEETFGWGGIDTDFNIRLRQAFGDDVWYDDTYPLMHVNHAPHLANAPRRPSENTRIAKTMQNLGINWLERNQTQNMLKTA